jgi:hypothetical protein
MAVTVTYEPGGIPEVDLAEISDTIRIAETGVTLELVVDRPGHTRIIAYDHVLDKILFELPWLK